MEEKAGSFKMEGILQFLCGNIKTAIQLRNLFVFKIVPMLNSEGVLCGNFRCGLTGTDLNRCWDNPDRYIHPQVYYLKQLLKKMTEESKSVLVFCDLHEHSQKLNSFMYGCNRIANGSFCTWTKVWLLPRILAKNSPLFSYTDCKFAVETDSIRLL
jgi:murein tripeptide amidase MpaA